MITYNLKYCIECLGEALWQKLDFIKIIKAMKINQQVQL